MTESVGSKARREIAGTLADGEVIDAVVLTGANGVRARVLSLGATLQSFSIRNDAGGSTDVVLGFDDVRNYAVGDHFFGATIGRFANRIADGRFSLEGAAWSLAQNEGSSSLHGGADRFDKAIWRIGLVESGPPARVVLHWISPDGAGGYPGELHATTTYSLDDAGSLQIVFEAATSKPTVVNMTNHALFNLAGEGENAGALGHRLSIPASAYTPVDTQLIPTGEIRPVDGSAFDFRQPRLLSNGLVDHEETQIRIARGYDHNFVLDKGRTPTAEPVALLEDPASGRRLEVFSTEPGLQLYSGNYLDGDLIGKSGGRYRQGAGIALEPQTFPNAPNEPGFPSARVDPDRPYRHVMVYRLTCPALRST